METTEAKSVRPLSSTDGEVVPEIAEEREDAAQAEQSRNASPKQVLTQFASMSICVSLLPPNPRLG